MKLALWSGVILCLLLLDEDVFLGKRLLDLVLEVVLAREELLVSSYSDAVPPVALGVVLHMSVHLSHLF